MKDSVQSDVRTYILLKVYVEQIINRIPCKHIVLVVDAGFGGTADKWLADQREKNHHQNIQPQLELIDGKLRIKPRRLLASGEGYVSDGFRGKHSPFASSFMDALSGGRASGLLTLSYIYSTYAGLISYRRGAYVQPQKPTTSYSTGQPPNQSMNSVIRMASGIARILFVS